MSGALAPTEKALLALGQALREDGYRFVAVSPETHRRVSTRPDAHHARSLADVFGWGRPFSRVLLPAHHVSLLRAAGVLGEVGGMWVSRVRFSTLGDGLYAHSGPAEDDAPFGPDTHRFCALLDREVASAGRVVDVGAGCGAGALSIAARAQGLVLADASPTALSYARVNAALAEREVEVVRGEGLDEVSGDVDLVIACPPALVDAVARADRAGAALGIARSARLVEAALARLSPGGRVVLHLGAPVKGGVDQLLRALEPLRIHARDWRYAELEPDVCGEALDTPAYAQMERIAAVSLVATLA